MRPITTALACALLCGFGCGGDDGDDTGAGTGTGDTGSDASDSTMGFPSTGDDDSDDTLTTASTDDSSSGNDATTATDPDSSSGATETGNDAVCMPAEGDDACYTCGKQMCCDEFMACVAEDPNCACVLDCLAALDDPGPTEAQTCSDDCDADFISLTPFFMMITQCQLDNCGNDCGG
ncbi:MAG TPA: hypothetical protein VFG69_07760 [Nannocystaceae bacterium]|nr:hypothetical protein [Nannocystaceae bacterium]